MNPARRRGVLLLAATALLWSTGGVGIKAVQNGPMAVVVYRSGIAAIALFAIFRPRIGRLTPAFVVSVVCYAACLTTFVVATKWTKAANAIFLQYSGIVWVMLLAPVILKEPLKGRDLVAAGVALSGMALFFVGKLEKGGLAGLLVAVLSGVFFAGIYLSLKRAPGQSEAAVAWGNVAAALSMLPFAASDLAVTPKSLLILALLGIFQIGIAYALLVKGLPLVSAAEASLIGMLEPVCNPIWEFARSGETPTGYAILGAVIVLAAISWRTLRA
ncbi:MAG: EamA family transporter [Acidobacteriota bacterium]